MRGSAALRTGVAPGGALAGPWVQNPLWTAARAVPSLDLRFADNKSLVDAVTGASLVTFTRASNGTFVGSDGVLQTAATDVPRFDHNPITGESLGLLVEEQRANLLLRSEEFDDAAWTPLSVPAAVTANNAIAPNGTLTADLITGVSAAADQLQQVVTLLNSTVYTYSIYIKQNTTLLTRIGLFNATASAWMGAVDIAWVAGVPSTSSTIGSPSSISYVAANNGWYRCSFALTTTATSAQVHFHPDRSNTQASAWTWGAQLEAGAFPTSYIPTTTAAATRSASLADLISGAIANNIRSFYVEFSSPAVGTSGVVSLNNNTAGERASVLTSGTDPRLVVQDGGVEQANIDGGTVAAGVRTRVAVRINADDFAISINGGAVVTDTSGTLPTVDRLMFGRTQAGEYLNGRIARFTGWSQLLPNATLQALDQ